jgi:hypothetical protein
MDEMLTDDEENDTDSDVEIQDTPPQRVTRSKMRQCPRTMVAVPVMQAPVETTGPMRVTRSKMRVKEKQPSPLGSDDGTPTPVTSGFHAPSTPSTVKVKPLG